MPERAHGWLFVVLALGATSCRPSLGSSAELGSLAVTHAAVSAPPAGAPAPAFLRIANHGSATDTLLGVVSPDADAVMLHAMVGGQMQSLPLLALPAGGEVRMRPGSYHLMLEGVRRPLAAGDTVTLVLRFAAAGELAFLVPVLRYSDAVRD